MQLSSFLCHESLFQTFFFSLYDDINTIDSWRRERERERKKETDPKKGLEDLGSGDTFSLFSFLSLFLSFSLSLSLCTDTSF